MSSSLRLTTAQALIKFLSVQYSERDGRRQRFSARWKEWFGKCHDDFADVFALRH